MNRIHLSLPPFSAQVKSILIFTLVLLFTSPALLSQSKKDKDEKKEKKSKPEKFIGKDEIQPQKYQGQKDLVTKVKAPKKQAAPGTKDLVTKVKAPPKKNPNPAANKLVIKVQPKSEQNMRDKANAMADYRGPTVNYPNKESLISNSKLHSQFKGNVQVKSIKSQQRQIQKKSSEVTNFAGKTRYVDISKKREKTAKKLASFRGPNLVKIPKKPRNAQSTFSQPNTIRKKANYDPRKLKKGRKVKKSELPNYEKKKNEKFHYDAGEVKMWKKGGEAVPAGRGERELPKVKKKKKKAKKYEEEPDPIIEE